MIRHFFLIIGFSAYLIGLPDACAQSWTQINRALYNGDYEKAKQKLDKRFKKNPKELELLFKYAVYFSIDPQQPHYNLDTAYYYALAALSVYTSEKDRAIVEKYHKKGLTGKELDRLKNKIEQKAFENTRHQHTLEAYTNFTATYLSSIFYEDAVKSRDSIAFSLTEEVGDLKAYRAFLDKYPKAAMRQTAKARYDTLLYLESTKNNSIEAYASFIKAHPASPLRKQAEQELYTLYTWSNDADKLLSFLQQHPDNHLAQQVWHRLWYITPKPQRKKLYRSLANPAFPDFSEEDNARLYLTWHNRSGQYGLINQDGITILDTGLAQIPNRYACQGIHRPFFLAMQGGRYAIFGKDGSQRTDYQFDEVNELGLGVLAVRDQHGWGMSHIGGFPLLPCEFDSVALLSDQLLLAQKNQKWALYSWTGIRLTDYLYDAVSMPYEYLILTYRDGKISKADVRSAQNFQHFQFTQEFIYHEFEKINNQFYKIKKGELWYLQDIKDLDKTIAKGFVIRQAGEFFIVNTGDRWNIFQKNHRRIGNRGYEDIIITNWLLGIKDLGKWGVLNHEGFVQTAAEYDSAVALGGSGILLQNKEGFWGCFPGHPLVKLGKHKRYTLLKATDTTLLIAYETPYGYTGVVDAAGQTILRPYFRRVEQAGGYLIVSGQQGKALFTARGKQLLPAAYQGIQHLEGHVFITFSNNRFGIYNARLEANTGQIFDSPPELYADSLIIGQQGGFGLTRLDGTPVTPFIFDEIRWWSQTQMLVRHEAKWRIFHIQQDRFAGQSFDSFHYLKNQADEVVIKTYRSSGYGIMSSRFGRVLGEEYTAIRNLGSPTSPFYLAEIHVTQAKLFIFMYFDLQGRVVREQIIRGQQFDKLHCHN